ncbi:MAG TPA: hypothetical protein VJ608_06445, partial [Albitalea sp.]|nr:hypothetical protein [Albitalea sp.]
MRNAVLAALTLLYPLAVYLGLGHFEPRWLAFLLLGLALVRLSTSRERMWWAAAVLAAALAVTT